MNRLKTIVAGVLGIAATGFADDGLDKAKELTPADVSQIRTQLPGVVLGPAPHVPPLGDASQWYPLRDVELLYDRPVDAGKTATLAMKPTTRKPGHPVGSRGGGWMMTVSDGATRYLSERKGEGVVIPTEVAVADGLVIRLNPPEPLVLEGIESGKTASRDITVKIYDVGDPSVVAHSGKVTCTWRDLGGWRVKTPMGEHDTRLVCVSYSGSVGPASVSAQKYMFLEQGVGPVAFSDAREISAFLFYNNDADHGGILRHRSDVDAASSAGKSKQ